MDHLLTNQPLSDESIENVDHLCFCLQLIPTANTEQTHIAACLRPYLIHTIFDFSAHIRDPQKFYPLLTSATQPAHADPFAQYDTTETSRDAGFERIDTFMTIINYIRTNCQGCTIFYGVTDNLLRHMFSQLLPVIVGDKRFLTNPTKYYKYAQLNQVPVRSFITTARQIGKTTTMAIVISALICVADGMDLCKIYARTQNQAVNLLSELKSIFFRIPLHLRPREILKQNETTLSIVSNANGLAATVMAAPGNVEGIRGHKPRVIVVDEYQFTLPEFWTQHIWALTQVTSRVLICASTPGEPGSYMAAETNKIKNSPHLYPESCVLDFSLVCQKHRNEDTPLLCRCKLENLPPWKNVAAIRQAQGQYGDGNTGDFIQEVLGEPVSSGTRIFDPKKLTAVFQADRFRFDGHPQGNIIYVAVDPSGGGESEMAIASILYTQESQILILALDSAMTKKMGAVDISNFVRAHLRNIRKNYKLHGCIFVPIVEDQGGVPMAQTICDIFSEQEFIPSIYLVGHRVDASCRSDGVPTTKAIKENMVFIIEGLLSDMRIKIFDLLQCTGSRNAIQSTGSSQPQELLALLLSQMTNLFYDEKKHITGKLGPGFKDDLAMAFMLAIYWSNKLRTSMPSLVTGEVVYDPHGALNYY